MKTTICDICREQEADCQFKVKYKIGGWYHIDICKTCFEMLMEVRREAQNERTYKEKRNSSRSR